MVGKLAFLENIPPMSLVFFRWLLVWIILLPFTYKDILKNKPKDEKYYKPLSKMYSDRFILELGYGENINNSIIKTVESKTGAKIRS